MAEPEEMYQCQTTSCGYIYNPDKGDRKGKIPKGNQFVDLPDDWKCPVCGAGKKMFKPLAGPGSALAGIVVVEIRMWRLGLFFSEHQRLYVLTVDLVFRQFCPN